jgi:hypothetical protein
LIAIEADSRSVGVTETEMFRSEDVTKSKHPFEIGRFARRQPVANLHTRGTASFDENGYVSMRMHLTRLIHHGWLYRALSVHSGEASASEDVVRFEENGSDIPGILFD